MHVYLYVFSTYMYIFIRHLYLPVVLACSLIKIVNTASLNESPVLAIKPYGLNFICLRSVSSDSFYVKFSRTDKMYAFFARIGAQIWNSIPYSIKILKRSSFRKRIKELLLNFLRSEDDYVEVSRLIKLFNTLG